MYFKQKKFQIVLHVWNEAEKRNRLGSKMLENLMFLKVNEILELNILTFFLLIRDKRKRNRRFFGLVSFHPTFISPQVHFTPGSFHPTFISPHI